MAVNIYAAKTYLSRLIAQVNAGETVVVTRHGHRLPCRSGRFVVHFSPRWIWAERR